MAPLGHNELIDIFFTDWQTTPFHIFRAPKAIFSSSAYAGQKQKHIISIGIAKMPMGIK